VSRTVNKFDFWLVTRETPKKGDQYLS